MQVGRCLVLESPNLSSQLQIPVVLAASCFKFAQLMWIVLHVMLLSSADMYGCHEQWT